MGVVRVTRPPHPAAPPCYPDPNRILQPQVFVVPTFRAELHPNSWMDALPQHVLDDTDLARQAQAGDREAFSALVSRYRRAVYGLCYHRLRDFESAQDACQETFTRAFTALPSLKEPKWFGTWLYRIAANVCGMCQRRSPPETVPFDDCQVALGTEEQPEVVAERREIRTAVLEALERLPEEQRLLLTLFYFDEGSYAQVAALVGIPERTVKSRLYEARQRLKGEVIDGLVRLVASQPLPDDFAERVLHACGCTEAACACLTRAQQIADGRARRVRHVMLDR